MMKVVVTGGSGRLGQAVVNDLREHGYQVLNIDVMPPPSDTGVPFRLCNLSDYGETFAALHGLDAVVHLAADPRPDVVHFEGAQRFHNNTLAAYNVFNAATALGMRRVVWASSETIYGFPFDVVVPDYVPMDELHTPYPQSSYALSKLLSETMAKQFSRRFNIPFIGLQLSNVVYQDVYAQCPQFWADPKMRIWDLWSYIDFRDAVQSIRKSLEINFTGADNFIIAADNTIMNRPSAELMAEYFPTAPIREGLGEFQALISNKKAKSVLGFEPQHSWRQYVSTAKETV